MFCLVSIRYGLRLLVLIGLRVRKLFRRRGGFGEGSRGGRIRGLREKNS